MPKPPTSNLQRPTSNAQPLTSSLQPLLSARLIIEEAPDEYTFRHSLTRDAVYSTLLARQRSALHRRVAETLEWLYPDPRDTLVPDLAFHFYAAGEWEKALTYSQRAGEAAQRMYAPREGIEHFTRAIQAAKNLGTVPFAKLYRARGHAYELVGEFEHARADQEAALDHARAAHDSYGEWQALVDLGFLWASRDYDHTGEYFRYALDLARTLGDPATLAKSLNRMGNWHLNREQPHLALTFHREALKIFQELNDRPGIAETLDLIALSYVEIGDWVQGEAYYRQAIALFRELDDRQGLSSSLAILAERGGWTLWGDVTVVPSVNLNEVVAEANEAIQLAREISWRSGEAFALIALGGVYYSKGDYARGLQFTRTSIAIAQEIEHQQWISLARSTLALVYMDLIALDEAEKEFILALQIAQRVQSAIMIDFASSGLASIYLQQGTLDKAQAVLDAALATSPDARAVLERENISKDEIHLTVMQRICLATYAELAFARGDPELALQIAERLISSTPNLTPDAVLPRLWRLRARVHISRQQFDLAENLLRAVQRVVAEQAVRPILWRVHTSLGELYQLQSRTDDAAREFSTARAIVQQLTDTIPDETLRANFSQRAAALLMP